MKICIFNSSMQLCTQIILNIYWNRTAIHRVSIRVVGIEILDSAKTGFSQTSYSRRFGIRQSLCWLVFVEVYCLEQRRKYNANPSDKP